MKKHKFRLLSVVLCIVMVLSLLPVYTLAASIASDTVTIDGLEYTVSYVSATGISIQGVLKNVSVSKTGKNKPTRNGNKITFMAYIDGNLGSTVFSAYEGTYSFTDDNCTAALRKTVEYQNGDTKVVFTVTRSAASHTGGTCSDPVCSRCGKTYDAPHDYHYEYNGRRQHRRVCALNSSHVTEWEDCSGGTSNCTYRAVCDFCGGTYGEPMYDVHVWEEYPINGVGGVSTTIWKASYGTKDAHKIHIRTCTLCNTKESQPHNFPNDPTCTTYQTCPDCNQSFNDSDNHDWGPWTSVDEKQHERHCVRVGCGYYEGGSSRKGNHNWTQSGTCSDCGYACRHTAYENSKCVVCNVACPHGAYQNSKCTTCGADCVHSYDRSTYKCKHCGISCPHDYEVEASFAATCGAQGIERYKCADCGHTYDKILEALGHAYTYTYDDLSHTGTCSVCGNMTTAFHTYETTYSAPTCTEDGHYTYVCTGCDYSYSKVTENRTGHYGGEATCLSPAICDTCGEAYGEYGDHYGGEATCTEPAVCDLCGEFHGQAKGHIPDLDDGDCTTDIPCTVCGGVAKEGSKYHVWDENNFCENCLQTKGFTFTFTYGDEVLFTRNVHTGGFYTFEEAEDRDGLSLLGWDEDGDGVIDYEIYDYVYVSEDRTFSAVYGTIYTIHYITYDIWQECYSESFFPVEGEAGEIVTLYDDFSPYYKFLGWALEEDGEVVYAPNEEIALSQNLTLYGVIRPYQATLELGEGAVWNDENGEPITILKGDYSGSWIELYDFPTRPGYIFKGFTDQNGGLMEPWQDEETGEWILDFYFDMSDLALTAVWEECTEHNYVDGKCEHCGMKLQGEVEKFSLVGANMTLGNDLKMNFMIKRSDMQDGFVAYVKQGDREPVEVELWEYNKSYYAASYSVAAKEMTDVLSIEVYDDEGNLVSEPFSRTVAQYAMTLLNNGSQSAKLKSVIVDMLDYGTEAQKYFGYREDAYANAEVTEEQQAAYATGAVQCKNIQDKILNCAGANLSLEDSILLNVFFTVTYKDALTAEVSFVDYKGNEVTADASLAKYSDMTKVIVDQIVLADAKRPVTVTVYDGETVVGQGVESVESYVARNLDNADTGAINMAIIKFATSAYNYLV